MKAKDIIEIKKKYPKSIAKLKEWDGIRQDGDIGLFKFTKFFQGERLLYNFFDEQEIIIKIDVYPNQEDAYSFDVEIFGGVCHEFIEEIFESRSKAEEAAFNKSFEILENKLKT